VAQGNTGSPSEPSYLCFHVVDPQPGSDAHVFDGFLKRLQHVLHRETFLKVAATGTLGLSERRFKDCEGREDLSCWLDAAKTFHGPPQAIRYVLVLSVHRPKQEATDPKLVALLMASEPSNESSRGSGSATDSLARDDRILLSSVTRTEALALTEGNVEAFFGHLLAQDRQRLRRQDLWRGSGSLVVQLIGQSTDFRQFHLLEDGTKETFSKEGVLRLQKVAAGSHQYTVADDEAMYGSLAVRADVVEDRLTRLTLDWPPAEPPRSDWNDITFISGLVAASAGTTLTVYGALDREQGFSIACADGGACSGPAVAEGSLSPNSPNQILALGIGVLAAGAMWMLGSAFLEPGEVPWISLGLGLALGAGAYATALAAQ
jgi:hypothetical protein